MTRRTTDHASGAPSPIGPYALAAHTDPGLVFLSGQTPIDPATGRLVDGDIATQTRQVFANLTAVLASAGLSLDDIVKVNVYLTSMADFADMNEIYRSTFAPPFPARTTVAVHELPLGAHVEIEAIAVTRP
ncbi:MULTISPECIES: Rid family detoxifying hydrolase [Propioniciclava]|uniref:Rid family detoxifying hydrolase n=1 Tax=Propioniciclava soli TaxID=2775081 RepID=A0ABZ3C7S0_9ACTN|nr:Rid family detoxifying hydrolase [Propioniciclava sinopodophylli]